jgi:hypothetical protein
MPAWADDFDSSSGDSGGGALLAFLALGPVVYFAIYFFYRNTHARHRHEKETEVAVDNLAVGDHLVEHKRRTRDRKLPGANSDQLVGAANGAGRSQTLGRNAAETLRKITG